MLDDVYGLRDAHLRVGVLTDVDALDEAHLAILHLHDQRTGADAVSEEADAFKQRAVSNAGGGEDDVLARGPVLRRCKSASGP